MQKVEKLSKKIRILFTIPNFDTAGSGKALLNIATRLNKDKFESHIACFHDRGLFYNEVKKSKIPINLFQFTASMSNRFLGLINTLLISKKIRKIKPHVIHSFHYAPDYSEALSAKFANVYWIFTKKNMNWGGNSKNGWKIRSFLANHIIIQNNDMAKRFYASSNKTTLIRRGINQLEFSNSYKIKKINIPQNSFVIVTVANLTPIKGVEYLINGFNKVANQINNLVLVIVGDDSNIYAQDLKKISHSLSNKHQIHFLGKRLDIPNILRQSNLFILPTIKNNGGEGCPVSLLEAMASKIPVLASDVPGNRDILSNLPDQLFIPEDSNSLADKIKLFVNQDNNQVLKIVEQQYKIINQSYLIEHEVYKHEQVYLKVLGRK